MSKLFECCHKCTKRTATRHSTCEEYLKDRKTLDELNASELKERNATNYSIGSVVKHTEYIRRHYGRRG